MSTPTAAAASKTRSQQRKASSSANQQDGNLAELCKKMDKKLDTVIANLTKIETRINELEAVQHRHSAAQQKTETQLQSMLEEQTSQATSLEYAHAEVKDTKASCKELSAQIAEINARLDKLDKKEAPAAKPQPDTNHQHLLIAGIPETPRENLAVIITSLAEKMEIEVAQNDICNTYRTKSKNIYVKFTSELLRDMIYKGRRQLRTKSITTKSLGMQTEANIYLNEVLNEEQKTIFFQARQKRKELDYKFIWTFHGAVYLKKTKDSKVIKITALEELSKLT